MNLNLQQARLIRLCEGRPLALNYISGTDDVLLQIFSDDKCKFISMLFKEAALTDEQIKESLLAPALKQLDASWFPDRFERMTKALETELLELQNV